MLLPLRKLVVLGLLGIRIVPLNHEFGSVSTLSHQSGRVRAATRSSDVPDNARPSRIFRRAGLRTKNVSTPATMLNNAATRKTVDQLPVYPASRFPKGMRMAATPFAVYSIP